MCNAEREASFAAGGNQFRHRLAVMSDDYGFAFLDQLQQVGELGFGLIYVAAGRGSSVNQWFISLC